MSGVGSSVRLYEMAESLDIPLPELNVENFKRAWIRFELVAKAKEWAAEKQLTVLPTLLRGKLVDHYMEFDADTRADLGKLKSALEKVAGRSEDPLAAARAFVSRDQGSQERVEDFAAALRKLFKQAYPGEALTSSVLHQRFLTGLRPSISRQLLLRKKPTELSEAIEGAVEVEYALGFDGGRVAVQEDKEVNLVQPSPALQSDDQLHKLMKTLDAMTERMEALESALASTRTRGGANNTTAGGTSGPTNQPGRSRRPIVCWLCRQEGHIRKHCPLNYAGSARMAGSWPGQY